MDEIKRYQEGQATDEERQSQTAAMPDLLAQMRRIPGWNRHTRNGKKAWMKKKRL